MGEAHAQITLAVKAGTIPHPLSECDPTLVAEDLPLAAGRDMDVRGKLAVCEKVRCLVSGTAVVVFTISGCCMCHVVKQLLFGLGVGPTIVELDRDASGSDIHDLLLRLGGQRRRQQVVPAVFVGGKFLGGIETVMACHINGTLVPLLKDAGALWL